MTEERCKSHRETLWITIAIVIVRKCLLLDFELMVDHWHCFLANRYALRLEILYVKYKAFVLRFVIVRGGLRSPL